MVALWPIHTGWRRFSEAFGILPRRLFRPSGLGGPREIQREKFKLFAVHVSVSFNERIISQKADKMLAFEDKTLANGDKDVEGRGKVMSTTMEASVLFKRSFPLQRYGKLARVFYEARRYMNPLVKKDFTLRRAKSIWQGTAKRIDADEMDALRLAEIEEMRREREEARTRLVDLDRRIAMADQAYSG